MDAFIASSAAACMDAGADVDATAEHTLSMNCHRRSEPPEMLSSSAKNSLRTYSSNASF